MLSDFDKAHIQQILSGHGDWFSAMLIRLIGHADKVNREKLRQVFPEHVEAFEAWYRGTPVDSRA